MVGAVAAAVTGALIAYVDSRSVPCNEIAACLNDAVPFLLISPVLTMLLLIAGFAVAGVKGPVANALATFLLVLLMSVWWTELYDHVGGVAFLAAGAACAAAVAAVTAGGDWRWRWAIVIVIGIALTLFSPVL